MDFPTTIIFKASSESSVFQNIVCFVELLTHSKNNYMLGPYKTDLMGEIHLSRLEIEREIKNEQELFPMDYNGGLTNCTGYIRFVVESEVDLNARIERVRKYFPDEANSLEKFINGSNNHFINKTTMSTYALSRSIEFTILTD